MTTPKADLTAIRKRHAKAKEDVLNNMGAAYSTRIEEDSYSIHADRAALLALLDAPEVLDPQVDHDAIDSVRAHLEYCHKNGLHLISCQTHHVAKLLTAFDMYTQERSTVPNTPVAEEVTREATCNICHDAASVASCTEKHCPIRKPVAGE